MAAGRHPRATRLRSFSIGTGGTGLSTAGMTVAGGSLWSGSEGEASTGDTAEWNSPGSRTAGTADFRFGAPPNRSILKSRHPRLGTPLRCRDAVHAPFIWPQGHLLPFQTGQEIVGPISNEK